MFVFLSILIVLVCLLLIGVVLIQESKGGGLASSFSASNQVMGVKRTGDFLEKATWSLAIALLVLSLAAAAVQSPEQAVETQESEIRDFVEGEPIAPPQGFQNNNIPTPAQQPAQQPTQQPEE